MKKRLREIIGDEQLITQFLQRKSYRLRITKPDIAASGIEASKQRVYLLSVLVITAYKSA